MTPDDIADAIEAVGGVVRRSAPDEPTVLIDLSLSQLNQIITAMENRGDHLNDDRGWRQTYERLQLVAVRVAYDPSAARANRACGRYHTVVRRGGE